MTGDHKNQNVRGRVMIGKNNEMTRIQNAKRFFFSNFIPIKVEIREARIIIIIPNRLKKLKKLVSLFLVRKLSF